MFAMNAEDVIRHLSLVPHPEGGLYREIFRDAPVGANRGCLTSIYYLPREHEKSHWHRVDAAEVRHFHAGAPLALALSPDGIDVVPHRLGVDFGAGERPLLVVPPGCWQSAESLGAWTLAGCTVAPAFQFEGFEMAPAGLAAGHAPSVTAKIRDMARGDGAPFISPWRGRRSD